MNFHSFYNTPFVYSVKRPSIRTDEVFRFSDSLHPQALSKPASCTSFKNGIEAVAPFRETEREEATNALRSASSTGHCFRRDAMKYPLKVSPAAVVSTTGTL